MAYHKEVIITVEEQEAAAQRASERAKEETWDRYPISHVYEEDYYVYVMRDTKTNKLLYSDEYQILEKKRATLIKSAGTRARNRIIQRIALYNSNVRRGLYDSPEDALKDKERILA